jgi:hypothetical protein
MLSNRIRFFPFWRGLAQPSLQPGARVKYIRFGMAVYEGATVLETGWFGRVHVVLPGGGDDWLSARNLFVVVDV